MLGDPIPQHRAAISTRLGAFYAASFLVVGIQLPFWPVWLAGRGLDPDAIAFLFAASIWARVITTPPIGALADRLGNRRGVMAALAALACTAYATLWPQSGYGGLLCLNILAAVAQSALMPIGDSMALAAVRLCGIDYGRIRVWGSISFILAAISGGALLGLNPGGGPGGNAVLGAVLAASVLLFAACCGVPDANPAPRSVRWTALGRFAADRRYWLFVASGAALQSSHQLYYGFGTLYWRKLGFPDAVIGALWGEGVAAEIVLFWYSAPLIRRFGPLGLMAFGGAAGILRWALIGVLPGLAAAAALQWLHGLTFGASHLGAMYFMARRVPPGAAATAQSLYGAVSAGLGSGVVMLGAGALYSAYGGRAYLFMALLSALGLSGIALLARLRQPDKH